MKLRALPLLGLAFLVGCTSLPTSGPVNHAEPHIPEHYAVDVLAEGPPNDGSPSDIVEGFLRAAAYGHSDKFQVATQYLAPGVQWEPLKSVTIFSSATNPSFAASADGSITVSVNAVARLDEAGRYFESTQKDFTGSFSLIRDSRNQWRIASLPQGLLVSDVNFRQTFVQSSLYFLARDFSSSVPELRWYPLESRERFLMRGLLGGPSPWMNPGVTSAFPAGTTLGPGGVTVTGSQVAIDLSSQILQLKPEERALMTAQIEATFAAMPEIATVAVTAMGRPFATGDANATLTLPQSISGPVMLIGGELRRLGSSQVMPVTGAPSLAAFDPSHPAAPFDGVDAPYVVLGGGKQLVSVPTDGTAPATLLVGRALIPPSIDRYAWTWSGEASNEGVLKVVDTAKNSFEVRAEWLRGRKVLRVQLAPDGARVAVLSSLDGASRLELAGVTRDVFGKPTSLGEPMRVAESLSALTDVNWIDQVSLAVLGSSLSEGRTRIHRVPIGGPLTTLPALEDVVSIASNRNDRSVVAATADGYLFVRAGSGWRTVASGVKDPNYSG